MTHTPGPWTIADALTGTYVRAADNRVLGEAHIAKVLKKANARLIAAAPELFSLAQHVAGGFIDQSIEEIQAQARRLIAKVEGK